MGSVDVTKFSLSVFELTRQLRCILSRWVATIRYESFLRSSVWNGEHHVVVAHKSVDFRVNSLLTNVLSRSSGNEGRGMSRWVTTIVIVGSSMSIVWDRFNHVVVRNKAIGLLSDTLLTDILDFLVLRSVSKIRGVRRRVTSVRKRSIFISAVRNWENHVVGSD